MSLRQTIVLLSVVNALFADSSYCGSESRISPSRAPLIASVFGLSNNIWKCMKSRVG